MWARCERRHRTSGRLALWGGVRPVLGVRYISTGEGLIYRLGGGLKSAWVYGLSDAGTLGGRW